MLASVASIFIDFIVFLGLNVDCLTIYKFILSLKFSPARILPVPAYLLIKTDIQHHISKNCQPFKEFSPSYRARICNGFKNIAQTLHNEQDKIIQDTKLKTHTAITFLYHYWLMGSLRQKHKFFYSHIQYPFNKY